MLSFLLFFQLSCGEPKIINTSGYPWNKEDDKILAQAKKRCGELYKDAACVKWIKKWGERDYSVACGK